MVQPLEQQQMFQVDYLLSRDLDSRPSDREVSAVNEWLESNKSFHFMRDHPQHGTTVLGGGWGVNLRGPDIRQKMKKVLTEALIDPIFFGGRNDRGKDQVFLDRYYFKKFLGLLLSAIHRLCSTFLSGMAKESIHEKLWNHWESNPEWPSWKLCLPYLKMVILPVEQSTY